MAKRRVLYVDHTAALGGGEIALANLISQLDRSRVDPLLLLFSDGPLRERVEKLLPVIVFPLPARILNARKDALGVGVLARVGDIAACAAFTVRLAKAIRELHVDIVHTNSLKADLLGGIAARLAGVPVVWHVRDRISSDYLPNSVVKAFRFLAGVIPSRIIANSASTMSTVMSYSNNVNRPRALKEYCIVVHDGVGPQPVLSGAPVKRDFVVFGLVGRISPWKGQDVFLQAAAKVLQSNPTAIFRVIGSPLFGEDEYERSLQALCESLGLSGSVEFTGFLSDVNAAIEKLDVVVHASVLAEPFGQVIIEGMAAGKPVIATEGGGVPEIVIDQVTGILVPMGDVDAMAAAMVRLCASPAERQTMGTLGKQRVQEHFSLQEVTRKVQGVYETIPAQKSFAYAAPSGLKAVVLPVQPDSEVRG